MESVEDKVLAMTNVDIRFLKRYVDDTCVVITVSKCEVFLGHLNLVEPTIQFHLEQELDGKVSCMGMLLEHHEDGSTSTSVFKKPTHTNKYLDFNSSHPLAHNLAVVQTLHHWAEILSLTQKVIDKEKARIWWMWCQRIITLDGFFSGSWGHLRRLEDTWWAVKGNNLPSLCSSGHCGIEEDPETISNQVCYEALPEPEAELSTYSYTFNIFIMCKVHVINVLTLTEGCRWNKVGPKVYDRQSESDRRQKHLQQGNAEQ